MTSAEKQGLKRQRLAASSFLPLLRFSALCLHSEVGQWFPQVLTHAAIKGKRQWLEVCVGGRCFNCVVCLILFPFFIIIIRFYFWRISVLQISACRKTCFLSLRHAEKEKFVPIRMSVSVAAECFKWSFHCFLLQKFMGFFYYMQFFLN